MRSTVRSAYSGRRPRVEADRQRLADLEVRAHRHAAPGDERRPRPAPAAARSGPRHSGRSRDGQAIRGRPQRCCMTPGGTLADGCGRQLPLARRRRPRQARRRAAKLAAQAQTAGRARRDPRPRTAAGQPAAARPVRLRHRRQFRRTGALPGARRRFPGGQEARQLSAAGACACGPAFARLAAELEGDALRQAIAEKFAIDLDGRPTMITVRGHSDGKDGRIHTDSATKLITLLLYLNPVWEEAGRPLAAAAARRRPRRLRRRDTAGVGHDGRLPAQRPLVPRPLPAQGRAPFGSAQLGDRPGRGAARAQPARLVGAAQGAQPVRLSGHRCRHGIRSRSWERRQSGLS